MNNQFFFKVTETITNLPDSDKEERTVILKKPEPAAVKPQVNQPMPAAVPAPAVPPTVIPAPASPQYAQFGSQPIIMDRPADSEKHGNTGKSMIYVLGGFLIIAIIVIIMLIVSGNGVSSGKTGEGASFDHNIAQAIQKISDSDYQGAQAYLQQAKEKLGEMESEEKKAELELYNTANAVLMDVDKLFGGSNHNGSFAYSLSEPSVLYPETSLSIDDDVDDVLSRLRGYSGSDNDVLRSAANREIANITTCEEVTHSYEDAQAIGLSFSFDDIKRLYSDEPSQPGMNSDFDNFNSAVEYISIGIEKLSKRNINTAKGYCIGEDEIFSELTALCNELEKFDSFRNVRSSLEKVENRGEDTIINENDDSLSAIDMYISEAGPCAMTAKMYRDKAVIMCMKNCEELADEKPSKEKMYREAYEYYKDYCDENDIEINENQIQTSQQG